ncbi:MAG: hypothetical protein E6K70_11630 [Planctomycetota bacterium]|nr:MAG: hypothetical protein E6K70_11630 [Planctomycetota bacterium]
MPYNTRIFWLRDSSERWEEQPANIGVFDGTTLLLEWIENFEGIEYVGRLQQDQSDGIRFRGSIDYDPDWPPGATYDLVRFNSDRNLLFFGRWTVNQRPIDRRRTYEGYWFIHMAYTPEQTTSEKVTQVVP